MPRRARGGRVLIRPARVNWGTATRHRALAEARLPTGGVRLGVRAQGRRAARKMRPQRLASPVTSCSIWAACASRSALSLANAFGCWAIAAFW